MDGGVQIILHNPLTYHNGILKVISSPRHKSYQQIPSKRKLTLIRSTAIGQRFAFTHFVAHFYNRLLVDGSALVRTLEFRQLILLRSEDRRVGKDENT